MVATYSGVITVPAGTPAIWLLEKAFVAGADGEGREDIAMRTTPFLKWPFSYYLRLQKASVTAVSLSEVSDASLRPFVPASPEISVVVRCQGRPGLFSVQTTHSTR